MDSASMAEFMDYRGILVENDCQVQTSRVTFYCLRRHASVLLPVVASLFGSMSFSNSDFAAWKQHRRQALLAALQKPSFVARRGFCAAMFGEAHPLGRYADASDIEALTADDVRSFFGERYTPDNITVVVAGEVDDMLLADVARSIPCRSAHMLGAALPAALPDGRRRCIVHIPGTTQTALRIGRVLPLRWDNPDFAAFMLLTTVLGGYFGSRLMSNLREEKGYTYGIYAATQIHRGIIVFHIIADVASGRARQAADEVVHELRRLTEEPVPDDELATVKNVLAGDFLRSVDGVFERSARFCDMLATGVDEQLTENLRQALGTATPQTLQSLAATFLNPDELFVSMAGEVADEE